MRTVVLAQLPSVSIEQSMHPLRGSSTCELVHHFKSQHVVLQVIAATLVRFVSQREIVRFLTFYLVEKSAQKYDVNFVSIVEYVQKNGGKQ